MAEYTSVDGYVIDTYEDAVAYIVACRDTHVVAVEHYDEGRPLHVEPGDREFHSEVTNDYNRVLSILEAHRG